MKNNKANYHNNAMKSVRLYKKGNIWGFDDKSLGLTFEPFVMGASEAIQDWIDNFSKVKNKETPSMIGSVNPFPGAEIIIQKFHPSKGIFTTGFGGILEIDPEFNELVKNGMVDTDLGGVWYRYKNKEGEIKELWFCPVFHSFFKPIPDVVYIKFSE